jgi:transcriptional regulator with XRE-family HTH domain
MAVMTKTRIREMRLKAGMSQVELAAAVGSQQSQISRLERGKIAATLDKLVAVSRALKVPLAELVDEGGS